MNLFTSSFEAHIERSVGGRYLTPDQIEKFLSKVSSRFKVTTLGKSVQGRTIKAVTLGGGPNKILMWSQMHGNETTTTKACLDFINFLNSNDRSVKTLLDNCTIMLIPMLNPDGAKVFTRANANNVDLNRDAQDRTQPESRILNKAYTDFEPDFCFNLHDQRTIYNVGETDKPATVSFLAPSHDPERSISKSRSVAMKLIIAMNNELQIMIPRQVGRYDDAFNANCVGDAFQMLGTPTILFEAGHFAEDYQRERTREYIFYALVKAVKAIVKNELKNLDQADYFSIPENNKLFYDVLIRNAEAIKSDTNKNFDVGILYREVLIDNDIQFLPEINIVGNLKNHFGHKEYNCLDNKSLKELKKQPVWELLNS